MGDNVNAHSSPRQSLDGEPECRPRARANHDRAAAAPVCRCARTTVSVPTGSLAHGRTKLGSLLL